MLLDPSLLDPSLAADGMQHLQDTFTNSLAFADQGGNLAGKFFQYSLAPYLGFLYFLKWEKNGTPPTAFFGSATKAAAAPGSRRAERPRKSSRMGVPVKPRDFRKWRSR